MQSQLASNFPLPPTVPTSPIKHIDNGTQYTPQRTLQESPVRNTAFITPPKTVWDEAQSPEPLHPEYTSTPQPQTPRRFDYSGLLMHDTEPRSPEREAPPAPREPEALAYSIIQSQVSEPVATPEKKRGAAVTASTQVDDLEQRPHTAEKVAATGLIASAAAALGFSRSKGASAPVIAEDETSERENSTRDVAAEQNMPLKDVSGNSGAPRATGPSKAEDDEAQSGLAPTVSHDQGSQTLLTAQQIEDAMRPRLNLDLPAVSSSEAVEPVQSPGSALPPAEGAQSGDLNTASTMISGYEIGQAIPLPSPVKRPSSSSSRRLSSSAAQHPPLPPDHRATIAKAGGRVTSPTRELSNSSHVSTLMGPPAFPASAMRRPRTPGSVRSPTRDSNAPPSSYHGRQHRGTVTSQLSQRSSVSSFASEIDERFNLPAQGQVAAHHFSTDPRIIQAITQTMIGEFLWKYTRKAGRSEMSETRHRRYFWVHPYTKTLYWSDQDPQSAGRSELKAKSVLIQSVEVVQDDNPMPPGLHRKSLEVVTPGRRVRFTATTGQRHETWFNALNYLLLRGDDPNGGAYTAGGQDITRDDLDEFNVNASGYGATLAPTGSRMSLSSYNSRTTRGTSSNRASANTRPGLAAGVTTGSIPTRPPPESVASRPAPDSTARRSRADPGQEADKDRTVRAGSVSRFSRMIGSVTGRTARMSEPASAATGLRSEGGSIYDASVVSDGRKDSAEELRREMLRQEEIGFGGLENVRACCDGMYFSPVGLLSGHGLTQDRRETRRVDIESQSSACHSAWSWPSVTQHESPGLCSARWCRVDPGQRRRVCIYTRTKRHAHTDECGSGSILEKTSTGSGQ
jgi:hypothetical protein